MIRTPCSNVIRIGYPKDIRTGYPNGGRTGYPKGGRIGLYGSPRYSMMILTCLALRLRLFLKGIDNSSRADISLGQPSIHLRNERTASTSLICPTCAGTFSTWQRPRGGWARRGVWEWQIPHSHIGAGCYPANSTQRAHGDGRN